MKNVVLNNICKNLTLDRISEVEDVLSEWWGSADLSDPRQYLGFVIDEERVSGSHG